VKKSNQLIVVEPNRLKAYSLDDKLVWEVGRPSQNNNPDIRMHAATVSRQQGWIRNINGVWFYAERKGKNGTFRNGKPVTCGIGGRIKPLLLKHGDVMLFGAGSEPVVDPRTVMTVFLEQCPEGTWRAEGTAASRKLLFTDGEQSLTLNKPAMGSFIELEKGIAIYMGEITWLLGDITVIGTL
jgi:pSer/pThr/pTyr-binding forkhead associated (FHA) protein